MDTPRVLRPVASNAIPPPSPFQGPSGSGMTVGDIYYVLFRHKWKILLCTLVGLLGAAAVYKFNPPSYHSDARLFIRYVMDARSASLTPEDSRMKSPDQRGETIINSEVEILTSQDVAATAASVVGPEKILAKVGGGKDINRAAALIGKSMKVEVPPYSSVIQIDISHPDPELVQPILREVIAAYLKKHVEVHRTAGMVGDFLTQETDQLRARLAQTEDELRKARNKAGVISLEGEKKSNADEIAHLRQEIFNTQAELAERGSVFQQYTKTTPTKTPTAEATPEPTADQLEEYRVATANLGQLQKKEQELLTQFTAENSRVREVHAQRIEAEALKKKLEDANPKLAGLGLSQSSPSGTGTGAKPYDALAESAQLNALQAKIKLLNSQLEAVRADVASADQIEGTILELQRRKELEETNYKYYAASLEQSRISEALGTGTVSNISQIQTPSPPFVDMGKTDKLMQGLAAGGLAVGLAWAFFIEFYLDRSVRRPVDVEKMLRLPLFISIPKIGHVAKASKLAAKQKSKSKSVTEGENSLALAPADGGPALHPFHETLRDRLISYFESEGLTHKPKLVAVTGFGRNTGVTTIAAGLASSLSETGEGNVLLVDMTQDQGSAQQFYKGNAVCGLEELLDTRDSAQIDGNLYVVGEGPGDNKLTRILPQRFNKLVPKLKASNFDYIIFDMPPVSQISITPRLAGFMDMVLLVIESEKTDREIVQRATDLLAQSKAKVGAVLNKSKYYVPKRLHQDREFLLGSFEE